MFGVRTAVHRGMVFLQCLARGWEGRGGHPRPSQRPPCLPTLEPPSLSSADGWAGRREDWEWGEEYYEVVGDQWGLVGDRVGRWGAPLSWGRRKDRVGCTLAKGGLAWGAQGVGRIHCGYRGLEGEELGEAGGGWEVGLSVGPASVWLGRV